MAESESLRTVVVAMDGSKQSEEAFQWFMRNVHRDNDRVILIHVPEYRNLYTTVAPMEIAHPSVIVELYEEEEKKTKQMLESLKKSLTNAGIGGKVKCEPGEPGQVIVKVAHENNAGLIVTGCRGLGVLRRTFMGSVSDYVLHHANVPVIIYRHKNHQEDMEQQQQQHDHKQ